MFFSFHIHITMFYSTTFVWQFFLPWKLLLVDPLFHLKRRQNGEYIIKNTWLILQDESLSLTHRSVGICTSTRGLQKNNSRHPRGMNHAKDCTNNATNSTPKPAKTHEQLMRRYQEKVDGLALIVFPIGECWVQHFLKRRISHKVMSDYALLIDGDRNHTRLTDSVKQCSFENISIVGINCGIHMSKALLIFNIAVWTSVYVNETLYVW